MKHRSRAQGTILGWFSDLGVEVNGLIIPGSLVEGALARHALNLVVNNDDEIFKIYLAGSASAIRYKGREILLVTQHQIKKIDASQIGILNKSGSHIITSGGGEVIIPVLIQMPMTSRLLTLPRRARIVLS